MNCKLVFVHPKDGKQEWLFDCPYIANRAAILLEKRFNTTVTTERYGPQRTKDARRTIATQEEND